MGLPPVCPDEGGAMTQERVGREERRPPETDEEREQERDEQREPDRDEERELETEEASPT